jgi:hypothetical protein
VGRSIEQEGDPCGRADSALYFESTKGQSHLVSSTALISAMIGQKAGPKIVPTNIAARSCDVYPIPTSFASMINLEE